jgi:biopolymer transport protein ExbD
MDRFKHGKHKYHEAEELNVTPFMNLMIVLVPVLLLSMVFTHTTVIDLNFPSGDGGQAELDPAAVHLEVVIEPEALLVADGRGGTIKHLPKIDGEHDYAQLSLVMQELKRRLPDKRDITVLLQQDTAYQTLVSVLDRVRSYPTVQHMEVVRAELFPDVSLGDAPVRPLPRPEVAAAESLDGGRS